MIHPLFIIASIKYRNATYKAATRFNTPATEISSPVRNWSREASTPRVPMTVLIPGTVVCALFKVDVIC